MHPHRIICDKIIKEILNVENLKFIKFRDYLYDIFIYNLNITDCVWYILSVLINENRINKKEHVSLILLKTYVFLKYYNNNYRPIYHLESYLFYLISIIHGFSSSD